LALSGRRCWIDVRTDEEIPDVEVDVIAGFVDIDMKQTWSARRMLGVDPGLFDAFTDSGFGNHLSCVDVATRLEPSAEASMPMEEDASRANHDGRPGDVHQVRMAIERVWQPGQLIQHPRQRRLLADITGVMGSECREQLCQPMTIGTRGPGGCALPSGHRVLDITGNLLAHKTDCPVHFALRRPCHGPPWTILEVLPRVRDWVRAWVRITTATQPPLTSGSGRLPALTMDPAALPLSRATPDTLALTVSQGVLEARLSHCTLVADRLGLVGFLVGDGIEHLGIDALAGCVLAPGGTHGNVLTA